MLRLTSSEVAQRVLLAALVVIVLMRFLLWLDLPTLMDVLPVVVGW